MTKSLVCFVIKHNDSARLAYAKNLPYEGHSFIEIDPHTPKTQRWRVIDKDPDGTLIVEPLQ